MKKLPVGIQLYGLRDILVRTPERLGEVAAALKEMGYDGVELAGLYGLAPEKLRSVLEENGLVAISAHVALAEMLADPEKTARDYAAIGCKFIAVPFLPEDQRPGKPGFEDVIAALPKMGKVMADHGMKLLYHNHNFEFVRLADGEYGYDNMFRRVPAELLATEQDTCWVKVAGEDPAEYLRKYTGRAPVVHLKDFVMRGDPKNLFELLGVKSKEKKEPDTGYFGFRPVGFGQQLWEPILEAAADAGAEWYIVEQDNPNELSSLEAARRSIAYLKILF